MIRLPSKKGEEINLSKPLIGYLKKEASKVRATDGRRERKFAKETKWRYVCNESYDCSHVRRRIRVYGHE